MYLLAVPPITSEPTPEPLPEGTGRVKYHFDVGGLPASTGHWFLAAADAYSASTCTELAGNIADLWPTPAMIGNFWEGCSLVKIEVQVVPTGGGEVAGFVALSLPGTITGDALPINAAAVLSLHDGSVYRGGKGRMYLPGFANSAASNVNVFSDEFVTAMNTAWADYLTAFNALTFGAGLPTFSVLHRWLAGVAITPNNLPVV